MTPSEILRKIRRIQIRTSHRVDEMLAGTWHSAFKGRGIEFEEVRPYQVGDDVRTIDWNVTARQDAPFVKLFREERELAVMLMVDCSASLDFGTQSQTKRELVTELGATLAMSAIKNNDRVGLTLFSEDIEKSFPPTARFTSCAATDSRNVDSSLQWIWDRCWSCSGTLAADRETKDGRVPDQRLPIQGLREIASRRFSKA